MAGPDLVQALSNRVNQSVLGVLAVEPNYPRRIGTLLSLPETEVARRLRLLESLGIVSSEWANIGRNVKLYRLVVHGVALRFSAAGIEVELDGAPAAAAAGTTLRIEPVEDVAPVASGFVGRERELAAMDAAPATIVVGIPGIGKTSLLARYLATRAGPRPVFWQGFRGVESLNWLANRFALFFAQHGDRRLMDALKREAEAADRHALILAGLRGLEGLIVFDDVHRIADEGVQHLVAEALADAGRSRVVAAGREAPRHQPGGKVQVLPLGGLRDDDILGLMAAKGLPVEDAPLATLRASTGGHPIALNLLFEMARGKGRPLADLLAELPGQGLEEYLLREVDGAISEDERRVLTLASVFRTAFTADDLAALSRRQVHPTLRRLRQRHLLDTRGEEVHLHEVLRTFFYEHAADKAGLHGRAAERYLAQGTIEGRLEAMHHYLMAEREDLVLELLDEDLDLDDFDLIDTGYHHLYSEILARFTRENVTNVRRWGLIEDERGDIAFARGDDAAALRHYEEAYAVFAKQGDGDRLADLCWKRGLTWERSGRPERARQACTEGLAQCTEGTLAHERLRALQGRLAGPAPARARARRK